MSRQRSDAGPRIPTWVFRWSCSVCKKNRDFLVDELWGQTQVFGRCRVCTKLIEVGTPHRQARITSR